MSGAQRGAEVGAMWGGWCRWALLLLALGAGCGEASEPAAVRQCDKDEDCGYLRACEDGVCAELECGLEEAQVCGVDWLTYYNECYARAAHVPVFARAACNHVACDDDQDCMGRRCVAQDFLRSERYCAQCGQDEDCAPSERCGPLGSCQAALPCGDDLACPSAAVCDLERGACSFDCRFELCLECRSDEGCRPWESCERGYCRAPD